jgi:hypothetical protein
MLEQAAKGVIAKLAEDITLHLHLHYISLCIKNDGFAEIKSNQMVVLHHQFYSLCF